MFADFADIDIDSCTFAALFLLFTLYLAAIQLVKEVD